MIGWCIHFRRLYIPSFSRTYGPCRCCGCVDCPGLVEAYSDRVAWEVGVEPMVRIYTPGLCCENWSDVVIGGRPRHRARPAELAVIAAFSIRTDNR